LSLSPTLGLRGGSPEELPITSRRFPAPWQVEQISGGHKVVDATCHTVAHVYGWRTVGKRSRIYRQVAAKFLETRGYLMYFNIGDTVVLKSGGPAMTVTAIDNEGLVVWCTWFDGNDEKQESFPADALEAYSD
jgi:uncharacterized protein YodC (DUF2158 family)